MNASAAELSFRSVIAQAAGAYRERWRMLLVAGLIVFVPLGGIELLDHELQHPLTEGHAGGALVVAVLAAALGHAAASLLGEVLYAGVVAAAVTDEHEVTVGRLFRELPIMRLIAVDLVWVLVVAAGLLAFVVPGFVFIAWFALVAPAVEVEDQGLWDAFRRSRELVRQRFWLVFGLIVPVIVLGDALASVGESVSLWGLGEGWVADWIASIVANLISSPPYALVAVILFLGLRDAPPRTAPAAG